MQFAKQIIGPQLLAGDFAFYGTGLAPISISANGGHVEVYYDGFIYFVCYIYGTQDAYSNVNDHQLRRDVLIQGLKREGK